MKLNPKLKDFWTTKKAIKCLAGGRMSGKSFDTAGIILYLASTYKIRVLCTRRFQAKISESVYALLKKIILEDDYFKPLFTIYESTIKCNKTGSEFIFFGIERNILDIKGLTDISITWVEESELLTEEQWEILRPTILREENSFCVLVFNPRYDTDFVYRNFVMNKREDTLLRLINYNENPFLSDSAKSLIENDKKHLEEDDFNHIYLGYPKSENQDSFIKRSWIDACIDAHIKLGIEAKGKYTIGYDIADSGNDACSTIKVYGNVTIDIKEWKAKEDELEQSAEKVFRMALENNAEIVYDTIGVGASAGSTFRRLNSEYKKNVVYSKFDAGAGVMSPNTEYRPLRKNKDHFENLKAQQWQIVADRMLHTYNAVIKGEPFKEDDIISISSSCDLINELKIELSSPLKEESRRGLVKVESKINMKKRGIQSPNIADAFIMAYFRDKNIIDYGTLTAF